MKPPDPEPLVVNQQTAAQMLGINTSTLRRWDREGKGPRVIRLSRLVRYRPEDLHRFLTQARTEMDGRATCPAR